MQIEIPVSVNMTSTKGKTVVNESWVNHDVFLSTVQQIVEVAEMTVAATDTVASTVLVQYKHLSWAEPTLNIPTVLYDNTEQTKHLLTGTIVSLEVLQFWFVYFGT